MLKVPSPPLMPSRRLDGLVAIHQAIGNQLLLVLSMVESIRGSVGEMNNTSGMRRLVASSA